MIPLICLTNRKHHWLVRGFAYLFNQFWGSGQDVILASYGRNDMTLPRNFHFHSIAPDNYPPEKWSDGLILLLQQIPAERFILILEDFYLTGPTDIHAIADLFFWMHNRPDVLRLELWGERKSKKQAQRYGIIKGRKAVITPPGTPYQISLQASIWNRDLMLEVLRPGETPWQFEIEGSKRASRGAYKILGMEFPPVRYEPVFQKGSIDRKRYEKIPGQCRAHIEKMGWINE